ncbi:MAG TPA: TIGR03560 family F420-dependent LLM class oxidoreductase [Acidimicrobiales bacterium]|nr:TIGR03560 family F420-dependent LLM class oxidoreductase [Acidimicrobiales bacterium]
MATRSIRWGAFVPQGWKLEYSGVSGADAWARSTEIARRAEAAGYDHLWVYDHVETVPRREATHVFEAWTMMAALAQVTDRVGLGQLVTCAGYRNAGLLAKQAACVDVMSGGRLIFGIGAGWYHEEYRAYGWEYRPDRVRLAILDETLRAVKLLWTEEQATFAGEHVSLNEAFCDPKPVQQLPPIWVGGEGEKITLRIAAELADATNWQVGLDAFVRKSKVLQEHCDRIGRDFDTISRTHGPDCRLFDTDGDVRRWLHSPEGGDLWGAGSREARNLYLRDNFVGTAEQVAEKVQGFVDAGANQFVLWFRDYPATDSLKGMLSDVVPLVT